jgi:hypothetical protein
MAAMETNSRDLAAAAAPIDQGVTHEREQLW